MFVLLVAVSVIISSPYSMIGVSSLLIMLRLVRGSNCCHCTPLFWRAKKFFLILSSLLLMCWFQLSVIVIVSPRYFMDLLKKSLCLVRYFRRVSPGEYLGFFWVCDYEVFYEVFG